MLISRALVSGIIVPLYIYPADDAGNCVPAWKSIASAASSHPDLTFTLIINPNSGPGAANSQPDAAHQKCIPTLKTSSNVKLIGYVATGFGNKDESAVETEINTYAGWAAAYRPSGIFFDEVPNTSDDFSKYQTYSSAAKSKLGTVTLNPGTEIPEQYYSISDQIVSEEVNFSDFDTSQLSITPSSPASKQAVILHDSPSSVPTSTVNELVGSVKIGALYITDAKEADNPYDEIPSYWDQFVDAVQAAE